MNENYDSIVVNKDVFTVDDAREAAKQLFEVQVDDFRALKDEKWYKHLLNAITFGSDRKKKIIRDIRSLSKLQTIFMRVYCENYKGLDAQLNELIDNLSKTNESLKKLYVNYIVGVQSQQSILELSQLEQDILLLLLCTYVSINGNDELLKKYRAGIAQTIGRGLPQGDFKPEMLEQISKGDVFYRFIVEMCAIDGGLDDFSVPENIYEALDYLTISKRAKDSIENQIRNELDSFGVDYLTSKYGKAEDTLLDDDLELADEDAVDEEFATIIIDKDVNIASGNSQVYKNKEVIVRANVNCEGELIFDHCTIVYNDTAMISTIKIEEIGKLTITGSTIQCMSDNKDRRRTEEYLFNCWGKAEIQNCKLIDCSYLFAARKEFYITDCEFMDCADHVIRSSVGDVDISITNNTIRQNGLKPFYRENLGELRAMISVQHASKAQFNNNVICEGSEFSNLYKEAYTKFRYVESDNMVISQSSFLDITGEICTKEIVECYFYNTRKFGIQGEVNYVGCQDAISVDNCVFEKCEDILDAGNNSKVINCQFVSCKNRLIKGDLADAGGILVKDCLFKDIANDSDASSDMIDMMLAVKDSSLVFRRNEHYNSKENRVEHCTFDGIGLNGAFLIAVDQYERPYDDTVVNISDCTFSHCETKRQCKDIIREECNYYGVFNKRQTLRCVKISNCYGLDKINTEGCSAVDTSINFTSTYGRHIGADHSVDE
jgi:hypothetical protein